MSAIPRTNFFTHESAAKRYARSRPYFHPIVIARTSTFRLASALSWQEADCMTQEPFDAGCSECGSDFHVATVVRPSDRPRIATWKSLPHSALFLFLASVSLSAAHATDQSQHASWVAAQGKSAPMGELGDRRINVDGDLAEWGDLREDGIVLHQLLDHTAGPVDEQQRDAALVKLLRDDRSIYVAIRVADKSVMNPFESVEYNGDCIELFLDARPLSGEGPKLGDDSYSEGVYQLLLVPPIQPGRAFRWREVDKKLRKIGPIEAAGRLTDSGYEIEVAIPLTSLLERPAPDRIKKPFGFEIMIDDLDEGGMEGASAPQRAYSRSATGGYSQNPNQFACADPGHRNPVKQPFLRKPKFRATTRDGKSRFEVAFATRTGATGSATEPSLKCHYAGTALDSAKVTNGINRTELAATRLKEDRYEALGVTIQWFQLTADSFLPGRYYLEAFSEAGKENLLRTSFYSFGGPPLEVIPVFTAEQSFDRLAKSWANLSLATHFPDGTKPVAGRVSITGWPALWFELSETAERAAEHGKPYTAPFGVRLQLLPDAGARSVWQHDLSLKMGEMNFEVTAGGLEPKPYELKALLVGPGERVREIEYRNTSSKGTTTIRPSVPFVITGPRETILKTSVADAPELLTQAVQVGDPARSQFPKDDMRDCQARSIHDLHVYNDRIYVGHGDWNENRGPIQIWSFATPGTNEQAEFRKEFVVDDESVDRFRDFGGQLYVPGIDSADKVDAQWELGNLYTKADGQWQKLRTIPNGIHVLDVAGLKDRLFVTAGTETGAALFESNDAGKTWRRCGTEGSELGRFYEMAAVRDFLFVTSGRAELGAYRYAQGKLQRLLIPVAPVENVQWCMVGRLERFGDGLVYRLSWRNAPAEPLCVLNDFEKGAVLVEFFRDKQVRDIVVRGGHCHVLVANRQPNADGKFVGSIYSSADLKAWMRVAEFTVPALPNSMETLGNQYFVGLANSQAWRSAGPASGTIWRLTR